MICNFAHDNEYSLLTVDICNYCIEYETYCIMESTYREIQCWVCKRMPFYMENIQQRYLMWINYQPPKFFVLIVYIYCRIVCPIYLMYRSA